MKAVDVAKITDVKDLPPLLNSDQVCQLLGIHRQTLYALCREQKIPFKRLGKRRMVFVRDDVVKAVGI